MRTTVRLLRIIGLLVLAVGLSACSAVKLGYNNAPQVVYWWLDGYLDFTDAQAPQVRDELDRLHRWHRSTELPKLAALLQQASQLAPGDISAPQACAVVNALRGRIGAVAQQAEPALAAVAPGLTAAQLEHLAQRYQRNDADFRKEWLDAGPAERAERRYRQWLERGESIYGALDDAQKAVLREQVAQSIFDPQLQAAERQRRQRDALQTLRQASAQPAQAAVLLRGYLLRTQDSPDPAWRNHRDQLLQESCRTFALLHASTTPTQREAAARRLRAYQRDLMELAGGS